MDRTDPCGGSDVGSIPAEGTANAVSVPSAREGVGKRKFPAEESSESELAKTSVENRGFSRRSASQRDDAAGDKSTPRKNRPQAIFS